MTDNHKQSKTPPQTVNSVAGSKPSVTKERASQSQPKVYTVRFKDSAPDWMKLKK